MLHLEPLRRKSPKNKIQKWKLEKVILFYFLVPITCLGKNVIMKLYQLGGIHVATLALGSRPKQRGCKVVSQKGARESLQMLSGVQESEWEWTFTLLKGVQLWELESRCIPESSKRDFRGQNSMVGGVLYIIGKLSTRATTLLQTASQSEVCLQSYGAPKSRESQLGQFRDSHLGVPEQKIHLDVSLVDKHKVYYKGESGGFPQVRAVVSLVCLCCPWFVLAPKVFQLCTNHFVWVLCRPVWMSKACHIFLVPSRSSNTPLYPSKCCELGSGSKFQLLPHCRILGPSSGSTRNLGARQLLNGD
jgi:hypothetical protein